MSVSTILPKLDNQNRTAHNNSNQATSYRDNKNTKSQFNTTRASNTVFNPESKESSTLKKQLLVVEDYTYNLNQELNEVKRSINTLNDEQLLATWETGDHFKKISKDVYVELQKVEDYTSSEFQIQAKENKKLQSQVDIEKNDLSKNKILYLELVERLENMYTHVGMGELKLEKGN
mmetsp:Transcript_15817/g.16417  ORF Transcript_15817/g.16417 Transcript_15817/m.16417 type:complete len:176 (-) Transcript_15817:382-909(-)|eukprot:CAMPEP_0170528756 /NCGR_PEP_ID=MMETSP0209-20121228/14231_1 /TAXON_ID=665100 ORGANISM="Litonotus pictus, Strain P1" /NCGR_SAMPLE_ID=MMETSP0209 /ASSEMBLY_ACC=CAM_ASM_000301 /LENGTH=175 /DNA_ID=CAMNT_0010820151 /DNA_START=5 /DNA_END=532 /DNA_ORIENTATION=-